MPGLDTAGPSPTAERHGPLGHWLTAGLFFWGAGVICNEGLAALGMAMVAAGAVVHAFRSRPLPARAVLVTWWPLWLFVGWALVVPFVGGHPPSGSGVARLFDWVGIPAGGWALREVGPRVRVRLAIAVGVLFLLSCAAAGLQHFGIWPQESFFTPLRWTGLPFHRVYEPVPGGEHRFMGGGLIFHRLKFSHVGGLAVVGAAAIGMRARGRTRAFAMGTAAAGFVAILLFPYARAATAALVGGLVVTIAFGAGKWGAALAAGVFLIAAALVLAVAPLRTRFMNSVTTSGSGERNLLVATGVAAVEAHPWTGVGLGRFRPSLFAPPGTPEHILENAGKAHNEFLSMAAETGVAGGALFAFLVAWLFRTAWTGSSNRAAAIGTLAYFVLLSTVHDPLFQAPFSMGLALALAASLMHRRTSPERVQAAATVAA